MPSHIGLTRTPRPNPGFTIIELLVAISIIAIMVGLLLSGLSRSRSAERSMRCGSNQRQIALGFSIYAYQNKGRCVGGRPARIGANSDPRNLYDVGNGDHFRPRWYVTLGALSSLYAFNQPSTNPADDNAKLIDNEVFVCPEVGWTNNRNSSYGYNFQFLGNTRNRVAPGDTTKKINFPVKYERILAHKTIMAGDNMGTAANFAAAARTPYQVSGVSVLSAWGNHAWALDPPRLHANSDSCDDSNPGIRSAPHARHNGKTNVVFVDGHAETVTLESLGYKVNANGSVAYADPGASNALFSGTGKDENTPAKNAP